MEACIRGANRLAVIVSVALPGKGFRLFSVLL
jgi:hypothetical protein